MYVFQDDIDWEDCGYDEKHRDFFRLLRRRHIDVFSVYEHMRFSTYFLRRLHQHNVLSSPEYEELMCSTQTLHAHSAMNKKLMDVINLKPRQLQELFVDKLFRYQAQLTMGDEEISPLSGWFKYKLSTFLLCQGI